MSNRAPATRLYVIQATRAPVAVVFRRGPSKHTLVLRWDTRRQVLEAGQWFKGRIYERRCDLSPNGSKMIYCAASNKPPLYCWTAVSRPPFLTALALWEGLGAWGGGGKFDRENRLGVNLMSTMIETVHTGRVPNSVKVRTTGEYAGRGEDSPINDQLLEARGWSRVAEGTVTRHTLDAPVWIELNPPEIWRRRSGEICLERRVLGVKEMNGPWYVEEYALADESGHTLHSFGRMDWMDFSIDGQLLFARDGRIGVVEIEGTESVTLVDRFDLSSLAFRNVEPVHDCKIWKDRPLALPEEFRIPPVDSH